jgi:hypothetical protein
MGSDRARRSYDASRMYRSVVAQQGRVTLEADANEAEELRAAASRAALVDTIGPSGSPDDGFKITLPAGLASYDFAIGAGTMYVGGLRVTSGGRAPHFFGQPKHEWLDYGAAGEKVDNPKFELVYLEVTEQEVTAVEDPALREVALGGPDTSARTRLIQRVKRVEVTGNGCREALDHARAHHWEPRQFLDDTTMQLVSRARLRADFVPLPGGADPCEPRARAGFLGPENQLIRVQISSSGNQLLWGYDNASSLYRATLTRGEAAVTLAADPVDAFHHPRDGRWIEVLVATVDLGEGGGPYMAATVGPTLRITGYDPTERRILLESAPPDALFDRDPRQVYVRVWENRQDLGSSVELVTGDRAPERTGMLVSFSGGPTVPGDHWLIGVRPSVPDTIYPARLKDAPQPPDGPARWAVPLATIRWSEQTTLTDCRHVFKNLVELTEEESGCCEVLVRPEDDAVRVIEDALARLHASSRGSLHIRFASGVFRLDRPLLLDGTEARVARGDRLELTVSGCGVGSVLMMPAHEVGLDLRNWRRVGVFDLAVDASLTGAGSTLRHLGGAISIVDCTAVHVERVVASCGGGPKRAASCLMVRNDRRTGHEDVRVRASDFWVGADQVGVLLINVARATVDDNHVRLNPKAAGNADADLEKNKLALIDRVRVGVTTWRPVASADRVDLQVPLGDGLMMSLITDKQLVPMWTRTLAVLDETRPTDPSEPAPEARVATASDHQRARKRIEAVLNEAVGREKLAGLSAAEKKTIVEVLAGRKQQSPSAVGQGIVVAGEVARDIRITNNTLSGVRKGIHVGLSVRNPSPIERAATISAGRVQIAGNTIEMSVTKDPGVHAGIFVGNAEATTIRDNQIDGLNPKAGAGEGVRVWGLLGRVLHVNGNVVRQLDTAIRIEPLPVDPDTRASWRVTENYAAPIVTPPTLSSALLVVADNVP